MTNAKHTSGPWQYVPSTEHHGPYVTSEFGSTICDCYIMTNPTALSVRNGGDSKPIHHMAEMADANAALIAAAPETAAERDALKKRVDELNAQWAESLNAEGRISAERDRLKMQLETSEIKREVNLKRIKWLEDANAELLEALEKARAEFRYDFCNTEEEFKALPIIRIIDAAIAKHGGAA